MFDAFADFRRGYAHDRIGIRVIIGGPVEDFHAEDALFQLVGLPSQRARHHKPQKLRISLAGMK